MPHDIIDNQSIKLADSIRSMLPRSAVAHFAVGYFFLSGLEAVADVLGNVQKLRLLIGATTNRETIEQIAEGYRRLDAVRRDLDAMAFTQPLTQAVKKELNLVKQRMLTGKELLAVLENIYVRHNLGAQAAGVQFEDRPPQPQVVCSESLV